MGREPLVANRTRTREYPTKVPALPVHVRYDGMSFHLKMATSPKRMRTGDPVREPVQMRPGATRNPVSCARDNSPGDNRDWQALCRKGVKRTSAERTPDLQHPAHSPERHWVKPNGTRPSCGGAIFAQFPCNNRSKLSLARCSSPSCIASSRSCSGAISTSSSSLNFWRN